MLIINECGFSTAAHEKMKKNIASLIERGVRSYLIVPEQQTVTAEAEMARELPAAAPLFFEVTNFTRLADGVFRSLGGVSRRQADAPSRSLLMWQTLTELSPVLDMTRGRPDVNDGLVKKALAAIGELEAGAIATEELSALSASTELSPRLKSKISDLVMISSLFRSLLEKKFGEREDAVIRCAKALSENPRHLSDAVFFVEGFTSFTEGQYRVISQLISRCELTLYLPLPRYDAEGFEFFEIAHTKSRVSALCDRLGTRKKLIRESDYDAEKPAALTEAIRLLWRTDGKIDNDSLQNTDSIRIFEAHTPFDECDFLCADIKRRVMEGARYSDFAIISRSAEEYLGALDVSLERAEIPYFTSRTRDASEYEAIKFIYSAYAALDGFKREDVIAYLKCGFCDAERDSLDEFELYVERWGLSGSRLCREEPWSMNPDGYTLRRRESADAELLRINEARDKIIKPLMRLERNTRGIHTVAEHAAILFDFLTEMRLEEKLSERCSQTGEALPLWKIITDSLDKIVETLGDMSVSREVFVSQLKILFRSVGIGKIPAFIDEVTVGGAEMLRLCGKRHIYILGLNQGKFPRAPKDESYFNERDKLTLSGMGINVTADLQLRSARELFFLSRAMSFAAESVTLLYSVCGTDFKPLRRADVISRLSDISGGVLSPVKISELPAEKRIYSVAQAKELIGTLSCEKRALTERALADIGESPFTDCRDISNANLTLGDEALGRIYGEELALTQTRIDSYVKCPLSYFCKYNLSLESAEPYEVGHSDIGSLVHAILENFFSRIEREKIELATLSQQTLEQITLDSAKAYMSELYAQSAPGEQTKIALERIYRATLPVVEDICLELKGSDFKPKFFELNIKKNAADTPEPTSFTYPSGRVSVYGQIDRVDTYKSGDRLYVRVIDYKTGNKHFTPEDLEKGENLQMFLYLKSIIDSKNPAFRECIGCADGDEIIPAGVIYVKTSPSDIKVDTDDGATVRAELKKTRERRGMILDDPIAIAAQNPEYLPVKYKKDGTPTAYSEKYLYTEDTWGELMEAVGEAVGRVSESMRKGDLHASPKKNGSDKTPCEYCEYKAICRIQFK